MEYGWNRVLNPLSHTSAILDDEVSLSDKISIRSGKSGGKKRSMEGAATVGRTYDRIMIHEWKPPLPPSVSSMHDEETQLEALQKQVELLNNDLQSHNELRKPMASLVSSNGTSYPFSGVLANFIISTPLGPQILGKRKQIGRKNPSTCLRRLLNIRLTSNRSERPCHYV